MRISRSEAGPDDWVVYNGYEGEVVAIYTTREEALEHARKVDWLSFCPYDIWESEPKGMIE